MHVDQSIIQKNNSSPTGVYLFSGKGKGSCVKTCLFEAATDAVPFVIAAAFTRLFALPLTSPILGIGTAAFVGKLVLKTLKWYDDRILINLTKEACKFNQKHPKLQLVSFIFVLTISFLSQTTALLTGIALGCFGATILDVENYKRRQQANRRIKDHRV